MTHRLWRAWIDPRLCSGNKTRQGWEGIRNYVKSGQLKSKCKRKRFESEKKKVDDDEDESEDEGEAELEKVKEGAIKERLNLVPVRDPIFSVWIFGPITVRILVRVMEKLKIWAILSLMFLWIISKQSDSKCGGWLFYSIFVIRKVSWIQNPWTSAIFQVLVHEFMTIYGLLKYWKGLSSIADVWLSKWEDGQANLTNSELQKNSLGKLSVYGGIGGAQAVFAVLVSITLALGSLIASRKYHSALLKKIFYAPMSFFDTTPLGNVLNRILGSMVNLK